MAESDWYIFVATSLVLTRAFPPMLIAKVATIAASITVTAIIKITPMTWDTASSLKT